MITKKVYRTRKKCIKYRAALNPNGTRFGQECFAKLSTWKCVGVSCGWYKESK